MAVLYDTSVVVLPPPSIFVRTFAFDGGERAAVVPIDILRDYAQSKTTPGTRAPDLFPGLIGFLVADRSQLLDNLDPGTVLVDNWLFDFSFGKPVKHPLAAKDLWHLDTLRATERHMGSGATIGVIDTGIDGNHPDLKKSIASFAAIDLNGVVTSPPVSDSRGHGTHVCGLIAGSETGVASAAKLRVINVFPSGVHKANVKQISQALDELIRAKVHAINFSVGSDGINEPMNALFARPITQGIPVIAGIGNDASENRTDAPGHFSAVIGVGATWNNGGTEQILGQTDWRTTTDWPAMANKPDICAPGAVWSCQNKGTYEFMQGTSMATAVASGVYAAWLSRDPTLLGVKALVGQLKKTAAAYNGVHKQRTNLGLLRY